VPEVDDAAPDANSPPSLTPKKGAAGAARHSDSCPPASPAFTEQIAAARGEVIYLIGGYARYDRPCAARRTCSRSPSSSPNPSSSPLCQCSAQARVAAEQGSAGRRLHRGN
jgi:hypothetical protein